MQTGLAAVFFTLVVFTTIGFMIRLPLKDGGGKAVIQYLTLGLMLVLVQSVPGKGALVSAQLTPVWWPVLVAVFAVGFLAASVAAAEPGRRKDVTAKTAISILLILFCMGVSYIASASVSMLTGVSIPWLAASLFIACLLRNTSEMSEEEFPGAQSETICQLSLILSAATLVIPV